MPELGRYARELRARFWKPTVEEEVRDELAAHLEMLEEELVARGAAPAEARRLARERFGDVARIGGECRDQGERRDREARRTRWWHELAQDTRYALRQLDANRRFALVAILTLGVGLGASTTIFGIADAVLLRPLAATMAEPTELLHGTLDALVLKTLAWGPRHGYAVARWIEGVSEDALRIEEGSLYPALHRLEKRGWVEAEWGLSENNRRAKFYRLTPQGRGELAQRVAEWGRFTRAVDRILTTVPEGV